MRLSILTVVLLVALRLAIGWHLFFEGAWKEQHKDSWTSMGFLLAGKGPAALPSRWLAGDPTVKRDGWRFEVEPPPPPPDLSAELLRRFTVPPIPDNLKDKPDLWHTYLPEPVQQEWEGYFDRFVKHYHLEGDALLQARNIFQRDKADTVKWLVEGAENIPRPPFAGGTQDATRKTQQRVRDYQDKLAEIKEIEEQERDKIGDGAKAKLDQARAEAELWRKSLLADVNTRTEQMKDDLRQVLTYEQKRMALPKPPSKPAEPALPWERLALLDGIVRWGLIGVGVCLLVGLLTRLACIGGIGFLLLFYLTAPPPPLGPADPQAREHFCVINWNLIEATALLALATTRSGRWFGLDGLLQFLLPWRRRQRPAAVYVSQPHSDVLTAVPAADGARGAAVSAPSLTRRN
jgi:uncharacterized membrane protein YphA (DoxX/SURF4 family)